MGTQATIKIYDEQDNQLLCIYSQFDGYHSGLGVKLQNILRERKIVNGFSMGDNEKSKVSNGMACLAMTICKQPQFWT